MPWAVAARILAPREYLNPDSSGHRLLGNRGLVAAMVAMGSRSQIPGFPAGPTTIAAIGRWADLLRAVAEEDQTHGCDHLEAFFGYVLQANETAIEDLQKAIDTHLHEQLGSFMSTAEKLRAEGLALGLEKGRVEGRVAGREEGRVEGCIDALRRLLIRRFGPLPASVEARLTAASQPELDQWLDRVLDAVDLPAVFHPTATR